MAFSLSSIARFVYFNCDFVTACASSDKGEWGGKGVPTPPEKYQNIGFLDISGPDSLRNQATIQCWAIIGPPVKRHLMAFRWRDDNDPLLVVF